MKQPVIPQSRGRHALAALEYALLLLVVVALGLAVWTGIGRKLVGAPGDETPQATG